MLVVIPVCRKDADICLQNLEWVSKLDQTPYSYTAAISHDRDFDPSAVIAAAKQRFANVLVFAYDPWRGNQAWPYPQNWAWQQTARWIEAGPKESWLWWEQDAVPVRKNWLKDIITEYHKAKQPFMGHIVENFDGHMNGVGCYPHDMSKHTTEALLCRQVAFDIVLGPAIQHKVRKANHLFQHLAGYEPYTFETYDDVTKAVDMKTALFHRCKNGTLVDRLMEGPNPTKRIDTIQREKSRVEATAVSDVSVVITNFQREDMLWRAYLSCKQAKVSNIVISSAGATQEVKKVIRRIIADNPTVSTTVRDDDDGCNKSWIRGAHMVKTKMMTILHDDDYLLPQYESVVAGKFKHADVVHWDGTKHTPAGVFPGKYTTREDLDTGLHPITYLLPFLLNPMAFTLSPVCGCYPTEHVLRTLEECESNFGKWAYLRPTMMVGNDLLLWLRSCQHYQTLYYSHDPFNSYGHWPGSASFDDVTNHRMGLLPIYKATRRYFVESAPRIIHVVPRYMPPSTETTTRIRNAIPTWEIGYSYEIVSPNHQWTWHRDSSSIKEKKCTPFLKDVLDRALDQCRDQDMIVLTNDDTITTAFLWFAAWDRLKGSQAACTFRRDVANISFVNPWKLTTPPIGTIQSGRDAFFFRPEWLVDHMDEIPDYILGFGDWDSTLALLIRMANGEKPKQDEMIQEMPCSEIPNGTVYHVAHTAEWTKTFDTVGMKYNRSLTDEFLKKRLGWSMPHLRGSW